MPDVLDARPGVLVERVDAEAVLFGVDDLKEPVAEEYPFRGANQALEDRLLERWP